MIFRILAVVLFLFLPTICSIITRIEDQTWRAVCATFIMVVCIQLIGTLALWLWGI